MAIAQSVVGYFPDSVVQDLQQGKGLHNKTLELPLQPGQAGSKVRVRRDDIDEVRVGPSTQGHTSVQLILKPEANYELVTAPPTEENLLTAINDPALTHGPGNLRFVIYVSPAYKQTEAGAFKLI
jgi:hypothetical protein